MQAESELAGRTAALSKASGALEVAQSELANAQRQLLHRDAEKDSIQRMLAARDETVAHLQVSPTLTFGLEADLSGRDAGYDASAAS